MVLGRPLSMGEQKPFCIACLLHLDTSSFILILLPHREMGAARLIIQLFSCSALLLLLLCKTCIAFAPSCISRTAYTRTTSLHVFGGPKTSSSQSSLSPIPKGISPFEKSMSKSIDIQAEFRKTAKRAIDAALSDDLKKIEIEFPPLLGGSQSKSQFDDFDNIQELDKNKDWTMNLAPMFLGENDYQKGKTWLIFPDLKECEIAKKEWAGQVSSLLK